MTSLYYWLLVYLAFILNTLYIKSRKLFKKYRMKYCADTILSFLFTYICSKFHYGIKIHLCIYLTAYTFF